MPKILGLEQKDLLHYLFVFAAIYFIPMLYVGMLGTWTWLAIPLGFITLVVFDKLAHKIFHV